MKTIKDIIELYKPKSADEDRFVKKHVIKKTEDANGNKDDVFNATNVKSVDRIPKHGYNPGEDQQVYEEAEKPDRLAAIAAAAKKKNAQIGKTVVTGSRGGVGGAETRRYPAGTLKNSHEPEGEELNELSKETLKSYTQKAVFSANPSTTHTPQRAKRVKGLIKATNKLYLKQYEEVEPEGEELDEARTKKSPIEKLFNRPSMQFAKKYTNKKSSDEIKMERLGFPARHLPKEDSDTGTTSSLEGKAKQGKIEDVAKRTMQNNSYESEGQQLNELGYEQNVSGRRRPGSPMDSAQIKRNSTLRRADAESPLKPSDSPIGKNAPVRPTVASSSSPVASPAPALTPSVPKPLSPVRSIAAAPAAKPVSSYKGTSATQNLAKLNNIKDVNKISVGQKINLGGDKSYTVQKGDTLDRISKRAAAPAAATAPSVRPTVAQGGRGGPSQTPAATEPKSNGFMSGRGNHPVDLGKVASSVKSFLMRPATSGRGAYGKQTAVNSSYEPEGDQFNELVLNPFLRGLLEATCKECGTTYKKGGSCSCCMKEDVQLDEILTPSMGAGAYIDDFVNSKNPKFAGKSKEKRRQMALAAYYAAKRGN